LTTAERFFAMPQSDEKEKMNNRTRAAVESPKTLRRTRRENKPDRVAIDGIDHERNAPHGEGKNARPETHGAKAL
jgi:hypothetical protein